MHKKAINQDELVYVSKFGQEYKAFCPICIYKTGVADRKGHLCVNMEKMLYHCFSCGSGGMIYADGNFKPRIHKLTPSNTRLVEYNELPMDCYHVYGDNPKDYHIANNAKAYLESRFVSIADAWDYDLRYCSSGTYFNRLIVPVVMFNKLVYFIARSLDPKEKLRYLNPKQMPRKGKIFNFDRAVRSSKELNKPIVVTEGVFSAMRVGPTAVATFGKDIDKTQAALLASTRLPLVIMFDEEAESASLKAADAIFGWGAEVRIADCPASDPDFCSEADKGKPADPAMCSPRSLETAVMKAFIYKRQLSAERIQCKRK